tara:strand:+ start:2225 stop:3715 length:1491 start_codon:yes stop_codon:yes gene_type:complete
MRSCLLRAPALSGQRKVEGCRYLTTVPLGVCEPPPPAPSPSKFQILNFSKKLVEHGHFGKIQRAFYNYQQEYNKQCLKKFKEILDTRGELRRQKWAELRVFLTNSQNAATRRYNVPTIFDNFAEGSEENYRSSASRSYGFSEHQDDMHSEFYEVTEGTSNDRKSFGSGKASEFDLANVDNADSEGEELRISVAELEDSARHYVYTHMEEMRLFEQNFDYCQDDWSNLKTLRRLRLKSEYPGKITVEKMGFTDFDPAAIRESKQKRWEGVAGIYQEELRKLGVDAACPDFPKFPVNIPVFYTLIPADKTLRESVPLHMPELAPKTYMNMMRERLRVRSKPADPPVKPTDGYVKIVTNEIIEPSSMEYLQDLQISHTKKVSLIVQLKDLQLPPLAEKRFIALVGPRYCSETGRVRITGNGYPNKSMNRLYAKQLLRELIHESYLALPQFVSLRDLENSVPAGILPLPAGSMAKVESGPTKEFALFRFVPEKFSEVASA